jgi:hypothetical protein
VGAADDHLPRHLSVRGRSLRRGALALLLLAPGVLAQSGATYTLDWRTLDAGGELEMQGGGYTLSSTIGQVDANALGPMANGPWSLDGGFWPGVLVPGGNGDALFQDGFE